MPNYNWLLIFPLGIVILYLLEEMGDEKVEIHTLVETENSWLVKTKNYDASPIENGTVAPTEHMKIELGHIDDRVVIRSLEYDKTRYDEKDVRERIKGKLINCRRCS